jgi:hypothetical protein
MVRTNSSTPKETKMLPPGVYFFLLLTALIVLANSCKKKNEQEPLVIIPTVTPLPYSVVGYLITPTDKTFNPDYYRAARSTLIDLQGWYKNQMGNNKTFKLNPVVLDTLTGLHNSSWFNSNNGDSLYNGTVAYGFYNSKYELKQLLGSKFDTVHNVYFIFVPADFPDETVPRGVAAEGIQNLEGLASSYPGSWRGGVGHALGHAFGLTEVAVANKDGIMSEGFLKYPACVLKPAEIDSLNASPFFQTQ